MLIEQPPRLLRWLYPCALWRMDPSERAVFLTFDDGPIPHVTPWVLEVLARYGIHATFFMVGDNIRKHPEEFRQVVAAGHTVGNHTFHHISGHIHGDFHFTTDVEDCQHLIDEGIRSVIPGYSRPTDELPLFRPPHGWMKRAQYAYVAKHYRVVMWDLVTRDYSMRLDADDVLDNVRRYARNGSIITFHDSLKSIGKLRTALPAAIEWLRDEGYDFRTL